MKVSIRALMILAAVCAVSIVVWRSTHVSSRAEAEAELRRLIDEEIRTISERVDQIHAEYDQTQQVILAQQHATKLAALEEEQSLIMRNWDVNLSEYRRSRFKKLRAEVSLKLFEAEARRGHSDYLEIPIVPWKP